MEKILKFIVGRRPEILVYQAIYETFEKAKFPINSKQQFLDVIATTEKTKLETLRLFAYEHLSSHFFPILDVSNALEKIAEIIEVQLYESFGQSSRCGQIGANYMPHPSDPNCELNCYFRHAMEIMELYESGLHGKELFEKVMASIYRYRSCLKKCREVHLPIEP